MSPRDLQSIPRAWVAADPLDVQRIAVRWLESAALHQLTTTLGTPGAVIQDRGALARWSAEILDTRRGGER